MKKSILFSVVVALALVSICIAATWTTGTGGKVTTSTTLAVTNFTTTVNTLSVYNSDATSELTVLVDCTTNVFATRIAAGTAIVIPATGTFTFDAREQASIKSLCYVADTGTPVMYVAGY